MLLQIQLPQQWLCPVFVLLNKGNSKKFGLKMVVEKNPNKNPFHGNV